MHARRKLSLQQCIDATVAIDPRFTCKRRTDRGDFEVTFGPGRHIVPSTFISNIKVGQRQC